MCAGVSYLAADFERRLSTGEGASIPAIASAGPRRAGLAAGASPPRATKDQEARSVAQDGGVGAVWPPAAPGMVDA
jgi:hypothetical protein